MVYDPEGDSLLFARNAEKYFTPASNVKLLTFYAGLKILPDTLAGLEYQTVGDSLIFRGTADPSFLHPDFGGLSMKVFDFLESNDKDLYYTDAHYEDKGLGPGWSWSDYQYAYSTEKSPFPVYGNVVRFTVEEITQQRIKADTGGAAMLLPGYFRAHLDTVKGDDREPLIYRSFNDNQFSYQPKADTSIHTVDKPFHYTPELITELLADTLGREVKYLGQAEGNHNRTGAFSTLSSVPTDTLFRRMLQPSDNFIAEQLILAMASHLEMTLDSRALIERVKQRYFRSMPDEPQWVDGSGLSRYNMITPRSVIWLLQKIREEFRSDSTLFGLLPAGGESGTIKEWYENREGGDPYVYAKTGTLSNNHCLSGYLKAKSGKVFLFSFMNNHYVGASSTVKTEMEKVLWHIYENH